MTLIVITSKRVGAHIAARRKEVLSAIKKLVPSLDAVGVSSRGKVDEEVFDHYVVGSRLRTMCDRMPNRIEVFRNHIPRKRYTIPQILTLKPLLNPYTATEVPDVKSLLKSISQHLTDAADFNIDLIDLMDPDAKPSKFDDVVTVTLDYLGPYGKVMKSEKRHIRFMYTMDGNEDLCENVNNLFRLNSIESDANLAALETGQLHLTTSMVEFLTGKERQ